MLSAMMSETAPKQELRAIEGTAPMLNAFPPGCRFHPRCPSAAADCRRDQPPLRPWGKVALACHHPLSPAAEGTP
jgi:oligopeptide/dipeptide ABC transporter ATP-binding protein